MTRRTLLSGVGILGAISLPRLRGRSNMEDIEGIKILFVAGFGPIVRDAKASQSLYRDDLHIPFKEEEGDYWHTAAVDGVKHFALWPLTQAAQSCFQKETWPADIPIPQAWLEFEVDNVEKATAELSSRGYRMLVTAQKEPWGQTVSRFLDPEGLLVGLTFTPSMRNPK
ncbi:MAG: VOC family protein [Bryobacteraceae bacterium]